MNKLTVKESEFGVPVGTYVGEFVGCQEREPPKERPGYGRGLEWRFRVTEGPFTGKLTSRTTSPLPTTRNSCGRLLAAMAGGGLSVGAEVDVDLFQGRRYVIQVEPSKFGDGTRVGTVFPHAIAAAPAANGTPLAPATAPAPASPPAAQQPPAPPAPPPSAQQPPSLPSRPPAPQAAAPTVRRFWHLPNGPGQQAELGTEQDVQNWIASTGADPVRTQVMLLGTHDWRPASEFGFKDKVQF
jgi:pyruvate/2-oxoglutarate dehydrogenase complex dihydrolipoamide acyltransferase (E2) component